MPPKEKTEDPAVQDPPAADITPPAVPDAAPDAAPDATQDPPTADAVTTDDVAALAGVVTAELPAQPKPEPFLSEGMRNDLELLGWAVDPSSGAKFVRDKETGEITVVHKK